MLLTANPKRTEHHMDNDGQSHGFATDELAAYYSNITSRINAELHDLEDRIAEAHTQIERDLAMIELRGLMLGLKCVERASGLA